MPFLAGQVIRASDMVAPLRAIKTVNQTVVSSMVVQTDTQLWVDLIGGHIYHIQLMLLTAGDPASDVRVEWSAPGGGIALTAGGNTRAAVGLAAGATSAVSAALVRLSPDALTNKVIYGLTAAAGVAMETFFVTCTTSERLQLQWSAGTSTALTLYVMTGSFIVATPLT